MRLYPRQLKSVKDLQQEKAKLLKIKEAEEKEGKKEKSKDGKGDGDGILGLVSNLAGAGPVVNIVVSKVLPILLKRKAKPAKAVAVVKDEKEKKSPGIAVTIAKDLALGYIKWKLLELTFKLVRNYLKKRKERKLEDKALAAVVK